jgi:hypothetical protein
LTLVISLILFNSSVRAANGLVEAESSAQLSLYQLNNEPITDLRVRKLSAYLATWQSPLTPYAEIFINSADKYQLDWKLVAAISGVESSFGKHVPINSYNAWGWNNGKYQFISWEHGIDYMHQALKEKYYDRGLSTPWQMGPVYAPPSSTWAGKVVYFEEELEEVDLSVTEQLALNL